MKALVATNKNEPLVCKDVEMPVPGDGEVLIRMQAGALNHRDVWILKGMYTGLTFPSILGSDGVGIDPDGRSVIINPSICYGKNPADKSGTYQIGGDYYRSLGMPQSGTFAEYMAIHKDYVVAKPKHMRIEEAAALPLAGLTAWRALFTKCKAKKGDKVLISGIGGGVALMAMQFAIAVGASVYVTSSSEEKIARAMAMGAKGGALYTQAGWAKGFGKSVGGFDVIIDSAGGDGFSDLIRLCNQEARVCFYGGTRGAINQLNPYPIFWNQLTIMGSTMGTAEDFREMVDFVDKYVIVPVVDSVYDLEDGNEACLKMEAGGQFGKIVLKIV